MIQWPWTWSENPNDWAVQLAAIFTGLYVLFTYRLMRSTALTARIALAETQRSKVAQLLPLLDRLSAIRDALAPSASVDTLESFIRMAGVVAQERLRLHSAIASARHLLIDAHSVLGSVYASLEMLHGHLLKLISSESSSTERLSDAIAARAGALGYINDAIEIIDDETQRLLRLDS
jgi:hypothetical protein